jgi:hypothetical protein
VKSFAEDDIAGWGAGSSAWEGSQVGTRLLRARPGRLGALWEGRKRLIAFCSSRLGAPFFGGISGRGSGALEIALGHEHADLFYREHGLLRPLEVGTSRIGGRENDFVKISGNIRDNRFGLRGIASMKVHGQISNTRDHVRRGHSWLGFPFPGGMGVRAHAAAPFTGVPHLVALKEWSCILGRLFYLERRGPPSTSEYDEALRSRCSKYGRYTSSTQSNRLQNREGGH